MQPIKIHKLHYAAPPSDILWQRKDLMLVAAGSGPCLRELYYRALANGKLQQLMLCRTTAEDYTMGSAEEKIMQTLRKASAISGVRVVVLYLNCLDILTRLDFDYIEQSLTEETGVMVRCFFRGPLGKMDIRHFIPVQKFMQSLPPECGSVQRRLIELPPLATDIAGVMDCLPQAEEAKVLVAPSGCQACLRDGDLCDKVQEQYYLDTKKQDFIYGIEDSCQEQCEKLLKERAYKSLNLISSYFQTSIPESLYEAARIDGCSEMGIFFRIAIPLSMPVIAVIALYYASGHWNGYFNAMIYLTRTELKPLQLVLRRILINSESAYDQAAAMEDADAEYLNFLMHQAHLAVTMKYSLVFIASAPMLCIYPFVQKFFVIFPFH